MKLKLKLFSLLVFTILVFTLTPKSEVFAASSINVSINGKLVVFTQDSGEPFIDSANRTQVPLRAVMEAAACDVTWDNFNNVVIVEKSNNIVKVPIGESYILVNGVKKNNDTAAQIIENRTYLPIRAVLEAFGDKVEWDRTTSTVIVGQSAGGLNFAYGYLTLVELEDKFYQIGAVVMAFDGEGNSYLSPDNSYGTEGLLSYIYNNYKISPVQRGSIAGWISPREDGKYHDFKWNWLNEREGFEEYILYNSDGSRTFSVNFRDHDYIRGLSSHSHSIWIPTKEIFDALGIKLEIEKDTVNKYLIIR